MPKLTIIRTIKTDGIIDGRTDPNWRKASAIKHIDFF